MNDNGREAGEGGAASRELYAPRLSSPESAATPRRSRLLKRLRRRLERAVDVLSILVIDAVILLGTYLLVPAVDKLVADGGALFVVAKAISHGTFLILYVLWVCIDLWDFWKDSRDEDRE